MLSGTKGVWMLCLGIGLLLTILLDALADAHMAPEPAVARALFILGLLLTVAATLLLLPVPGRCRSCSRSPSSTCCKERSWGLSISHRRMNSAGRSRGVPSSLPVEQAASC